MFLGFVLGAIGGAAFTLLRTPRSGRELRGEIANQASRLSGRAQQPVDQAWQASTTAWQQTTQAASDAVDAADEALDGLGG